MRTTDRFYRTKGRGRKKTLHRTKRTETLRAFEPSADFRLRKIFGEIGVPRATAFIPDDFQLEAIEKIKHNDVLVSAPTGVASRLSTCNTPPPGTRGGSTMRDTLLLLQVACLGPLAHRRQT